MNSFIGVILVLFDACICTKYLLVEIPKIERVISYPEENQANEFVHYNKNESASDAFQSSQRIRPNGFSIKSKTSFGIKHFVPVTFSHNLINNFNFSYYTLI